MIVTKHLEVNQIFALNNQHGDDMPLNKRKTKAEHVDHYNMAK